MRLYSVPFFAVLIAFAVTLRAQSSTTYAYPDTSAGLRQQLEVLVTTHLSGDKVAFRDAIDTLTIPDANVWISTRFAPADVAKLQRDYRLAVANFERQMIWQVETIESLPDKTIAVAGCDLPRRPEETGPEASVPSPRDPVAIQCVRYGPQHSPKMSPDSWRTSFLYIDGAFRFAGDSYPFWWRDLEGLRRVQSSDYKLITRVAPKYPEKARKQGIEGEVRIHITVDKDGVPRNLQTLSGHPLLADAAIKAVRQWRYAPLIRNGGPVEFETTITLNFQFNRQP